MQGRFISALFGVAALWTGLIAGAAPASAAPKAPRGQSNFYLKDGDRVVFYGDSITDQRLYTTYIESYCVARFPKSHFTFTHSGWGGDRVGGGGGGPIDMRIDRDILPYKPTVVTICLGMNDGSYRSFDQNIFNTYVTGYRHILDRLTKELPGVRVTLLTAPAFDDVTRPANFPGGYNATLIAYGEAVKGLAHEYGMTVADTNSPLVGALARANTANAAEAPHIIGDRVHPGPGGHILMAAAVLKAWNAPATVADVEINATSKTVVKHDNASITGLSVAPEKITFTETDNALPWPLDRDPNANNGTQLVLSVSDEESTLDRYQLKITGLTGASYAVKVDGQAVGTWTGADLQNGVDLAAIPNWPANVQAQQLLNVTRKHTEIRYKAWRGIRDPQKPIPADIQTQIDALTKDEAVAVKEQHDAAQPKPHTIELTPGQ